MRKILKSLKENCFTTFVILFFLLLIVTITWVSYEFIYLPYSNAFSGVTPNAKNSNDIRAAWGQLGDYFGGTLNPIFGFASFIALLITILYQAKELNASTKELRNSATALAAQNKAIELQSFEQTFFSWVDTYRSLLNDISGKSGPMLNNPSNGREYLHGTFDNIFSAENVISNFIKRRDNGTYSNEFHEPDKYNFILEANIHILGPYGILERLSSHIPSDVIQREISLWNSLYFHNIYKLDSLFRTAYKILVWIDSKDSSKLTDSEKWLYVSIFRSQLSNIELVYLFFNGLTPVGEKFKPILEKYAIFDNFDPNSDSRTKVLHSNRNCLNYYTDEAFSSDLAKAKLQIFS